MSFTRWALRCEERRYTHLAAQRPLRFEGELPEVPGSSLQLSDSFLAKGHALARPLALQSAVSCSPTEANATPRTTCIKAQTTKNLIT